MYFPGNSSKILRRTCDKMLPYALLVDARDIHHGAEGAWAVWALLSSSVLCHRHCEDKALEDKEASLVWRMWAHPAGELADHVMPLGLCSCTF